MVMRYAMTVHSISPRNPRSVTSQRLKIGDRAKRDSISSDSRAAGIPSLFQTSTSGRGREQEVGDWH